MMTCRRCSVLALVVMLAVGTSLADNILLNSDLEEGPEEQYFATSAPWLEIGAWTAVGAGSTSGIYKVYDEPANYVHSGNRSIRTGRGHVYIWQNAAVEGGQAYEISGWTCALKAGGTNWDEEQTMLVDVYWFESESATMDDISICIGSETVIAHHPENYYQWDEITQTTLAPENAKSVILKIGHKSLGGDCVRPDIYIDDISMSAVPEPATLSLMGMCCLALARRFR